METCPGCAGRNPPDLAVCPFCQSRLGAHSNGARKFRPALLATFLLGGLLVGIVLVVVARVVLLR